MLACGKCHRGYLCSKASRLGGWVGDITEPIDADADQRINTRVDALNAASMIEVAVRTVPMVPTTAKAVAAELFKHWGIAALVLRISPPPSFAPLMDPHSPQSIKSKNANKSVF